ncbi:MAG: hypothetical protein ACOZCK_09895 [Pseudomonadota bacterium]
MGLIKDSRLKAEKNPPEKKFLPLLRQKRSDDYAEIPVGHATGNSQFLWISLWAVPEQSAKSHSITGD